LYLHSNMTVCKGLVEHDLVDSMSLKFRAQTPHNMRRNKELYRDIPCSKSHDIKGMCGNQPEFWPSTSSSLIILDLVRLHLFDYKYTSWITNSNWSFTSSRFNLSITRVRTWPIPYIVHLQCYKSRSSSTYPLEKHMGFKPRTYLGGHVQQSRFLAALNLLWQMAWRYGLRRI